jgi:putative ABC transport system permease protein
MNFWNWIFHRRPHPDAELEEEIQAHLRMAAEERIAQGESAEEARTSATREFGNVLLVKETTRDMWGLVWLETLLQDLRYGLRQLLRNPGFTVVAVLTLALGIGANTAIFSLIDAVLLRTLPVSEPQHLVFLDNSDEQGNQINGFSYPEFIYIRDHTHTLNTLAYTRVDLSLSAGPVRDVPSGTLVSDNYFFVLGVQPLIGREFLPGDETVAVISHRFWKSRFGGDVGIAGRAVVLNGLSFTIIGVTPPGFFGVEVGTSPDIFVPLTMRDRLSPGRPILSSRNDFWLTIMARLRPGVSREQASAEAEVLYHQANAEETQDLPADHPLVKMFRGMHITLAPGDKGSGDLRDQFGKPLLILMLIVGLVLLIACTNVASLLLTRTTARHKEMAVRLALGAGRARLLRQVLTESMVLSITGGLLGMLFAYWAAEVLVGFLNQSVLDVAPDARVLAFTLALSVLTGLVFGSAPAIQSACPDFTSALKGEQAASAPGRGLKLRNLLVAGQVAVSLSLIVGAGLFIRTLANLKNLETGLHANNVLLVSLNPGLSRYGPQRIRSFYDQLLERVQALPGVRSASVADSPLLGGRWFDGLVVEGHTSQPGEPGVAVKLVTPRFFETMGILIRSGRDFLPQDRPGSSKVAIINETLARYYFAGQNPIGKRIGVGTLTPDLEVVGVIADTKYGGLRDPIPQTVYLPMNQSQSPHAARTLHVRVFANPANYAAAIQNQIRALDKDLTVSHIQMFSDLVDQDLVQERLIAALSGFFGALALLLVAVGLYGVITFGVQRRTREIGIRMALGSNPGMVMRMVLRDCLGTVGVGAVIGLPLSLWFSKLVTSQLYGVSPGDPITIATATLLLIAVAGLAGYLPARRASHVDPIVALRHE